MNTHAGRPIYCESCGKWLGSAANSPDPAAPIHMLCPDCLSRLASPEASADAERPSRDEQPSGLVLLAGAATAATAGLLALMLRELRNRR